MNIKDKNIVEFTKYDLQDKIYPVIENNFKKTGNYNFRMTLTRDKNDIKMRTEYRQKTLWDKIKEFFEYLTGIN